MASFTPTDVYQDETSDLGSTSAPTSPGDRSFQSINGNAIAGASSSASTGPSIIQIRGETYTYAENLLRKKKRSSWVHQHGIELRSKSYNKAKWWYQACHKDGVDLLINANSTNHIKAHLQKIHQITDVEGDLRHNMALTILSETQLLPLSAEHVARFNKSLIE